VRVVSATNRQLEEEVFKGKFREDLYYRVRVCHVAIPPLRERPEDVPALVNHHLAMIATRERRPIPPLTRGALQKLVAYRWPGNVRELVNALERAVVVAPNGGPIDGAHIELPDAQPAIASYRDAKERFEQAYYAHLLRAARGNVAHAARIADKTRKEVYDAVKRIGLDVESFRDGAEPAPSPRGRRSE
jgi:two-component system response regulator GlrR